MQLSSAACHGLHKWTEWRHHLGPFGPQWRLGSHLHYLEAPKFGTFNNKHMDAKPYLDEYVHDLLKHLELKEKMIIERWLNLTIDDPVERLRQVVTY